MYPQNLDGYFTNLICEMEANRRRLVEDHDASAACPPPDRRLLAWLAGFSTLWFGAVTIGLWL